MRRLVVTLVVAFAMSCGGVMAWQAQAMVGAKTGHLGAAVKSAPSITDAACRGVNGQHCPPGFDWNGNKCVPC